MKIQIKAIPQSIDEKKYTLDVVMSAQVVDRQGDIVDIQTLNFDEFLSNPVLLQYHDYYKNPVGKIVKIWKGVEGGVQVLMATIQFAVEEYDVAKTMFALYKGGYMSAFSIGFQVGRAETDAETGITTLYDCSLLELSCVAIPANQLALAKSKGLDIKKADDYIPAEKLHNEIKDTMISLKSLIEEKKEAKVEVKTPETTEKKQEIDKNAQKLLIKRNMIKRAFEIALRNM